MTELTDKEWAKDTRSWALAQLLIEARDALPAISLASAKLHGISLTLAKRIDKALEPWEVKEGEPGI